MNDPTKGISARLAALDPAQRALLELRLKKRGLRLPRPTPQSVPKRADPHDCPLSIDQEGIWHIWQSTLR